jgi:hypothetical protein
MRRPINVDDKLERAHGYLATATYRATPCRAIALDCARRISSNTAQRTSIRFGSYTWNMQGEPLP